MGDEDVLLAGYLRKSPPENKFLVSSWQRRYFVLHANKKLHYFKTEKEKRPVKDPINLAFCKSVESHLDHCKFKNVFSIVTEQRTYYLVAETQADMENWVDKLCHVCGFRRTDGNRSPDLNASLKGNVYQTSPAHSRPISTAKARTINSVGSPSSVSSSGSSVTSPTGPCPLSIPKHVIDERNKLRSMSDPPEHSNNPQPHREKQRRVSEQVGSITCPINFQGVSSGAFSPTGHLANPTENYDVLPSPRSRDTHDNLPSPQKAHRGQEKQENYDNVPLPRPTQDRLKSPSSPKAKSQHHLSPRQEDYDAVPVPRPVSQASNRSSQDVYDFVPPPRPTSTCSDTYDVPPVVRASESENYDIVPPARGMHGDGRDIYDTPPSIKTPENENYDFVPPARQTSHNNAQHGEDLYDVPPGFGREQENYDTVPPPRPKSYNDSQDGRPLYNGTPIGRMHRQDQENYDYVPQPRRVSSCSDTQDGQGLYDVPPLGRESEQAMNYDVLPPVRRQRYIEQDSSNENYDVVPIPRPTSQEVYDIVPPARPARIASDSGSMPRDQSGGDPRFSEVFNAQASEHSGQDMYDWVPPPRDAYDTLPKTTRPVSADSGLNASFSSICSLKSEGQDDRYDAPLPPVPQEKRDSGSLSDETPDYDPEEIYDKPPNLASRDSIYDVPPGRSGDYNVPPTQTDEIYDVPPNTSDDIYDVPPQHPSQGYVNSPQGIPVVDRSKKPAPQVNRASKPKTLTQEHSYCNMAPPVNRESKYKQSTMPQPEPSYINSPFATPPQRPQNLPLVKILNGNPYVGSLPSRRSAAVEEDAEYCIMEPTRSEFTRCYSFDRDDRQRSPVADQCYEDMSAMKRRLSGAKSSSSSSSSLADDDSYTHMAPPHVGSSPIQMDQSQRHRRDLLYAEVEITESPHPKTALPIPTARKANTHYTYINEESTRALLETSNARRGNR